METITIISLLIILAAQLGFIFLQHVFYNKKITELKDGIKAIEIQLEDKVYVLRELQGYLEKQ